MPGNARAPFGAGRRPQALAFACGLLAVAAIWSLIALYVADKHDEAIKQSRIDVVNLSVAIGEQVSRTVEGADMAMRMIAAAHAKDPAAFSLKDWLGAMSADAVANDVIQFDASGDLVAARTPPPPGAPKVNVADRPYFKSLAANPSTGLYIDHTITGRIQNKRGLQLARRLEAADGSFMGVVVVPLDPEYLAARFAEMDVGDDGSVSLFGTDGYLRARTPFSTGMFDRDVGDASGLRKALSSATKGTYVAESAFDGTLRVFGFKAIPGLPLVVTVGQSVETVLVPYRQERDIAVTTGLVATGVCLAMLVISLVSLERRRHREYLLSEANAALRISEARYRALSDMLPQLVWSFREGEEAAGYMNRRYVDYYGEAGPDRAFRLSRNHPEDAARMEAACDLARREGKGYEIEGRLKGADGTYRWHKVVVVPVEKEGAVTGWVGTALDIDDLVGGRRALEEKTALLELALGAAGAGSWDFDLLTGAISLSPESARLHGLPEAPIVMDMEAWKRLVDPGDAERVLRDIESGRDDPESLDHEFRVHLRDGTTRWVQSVGRTYQDGGRPVRRIGLNLDVTAKREARAALLNAKTEAEAARASAEQASAAKTDFLATMSHEVRTPLNAMIGYTGLLADSDRLDDDLRRHAELARSAGSALLLIVNDILDFSKVEAGQVELERAPFQVTATLGSCIAIVRGAAAAKPVEVRSSIDPALPPWLVGDDGRLRQVLLNLLNNAIKFTASGTVTLGARHEGSSARGETVRFSVTDTGIGIPKDRHHRLFQRFSQVDSSTNRVYGGTGLGLAICRSLVELMGGEIGVFSDEGRGSTFWFTVCLPRGSQATAAASLPAQERLKGRILLVEDTEINRELAKVVLGMAGHSVETACDGVEAVEAARSGAFDLILMDVQMPGMDGISATRLIRALDGPASTLPIVAMTANVLPEEVLRFRQAGMDDHVGKPFDRDALHDTIEAWLRKGRSDAQAHARGPRLVSAR